MDLIASLTSSLALVSATSVTSPHVSPIVTDAQELSDFSCRISTRESLTTVKDDERNEMKGKYLKFAEASLVVMTSLTARISRRLAGFVETVVRARMRH